MKHWSVTQAPTDGHRDAKPEKVDYIYHLVSVIVKYGSIIIWKLEITALNSSLLGNEKITENEKNGREFLFMA